MPLANWPPATRWYAGVAISQSIRFGNGSFLSNKLTIVQGGGGGAVDIARTVTGSWILLSFFSFVVAVSFGLAKRLARKLRRLPGSNTTELHIYGVSVAWISTESKRDLNI